MDCARIVEHLELALIELEYASADFAHKTGEPVGPREALDLETVRAKLQAANRAMELAVQLLAAQSFATEHAPAGPDETSSD